MVHHTSSNDLPTALSVAQTRTVSDTSKQWGEASTQENEIGCFQSSRRTLLEQEISSEAVEIILSSRRASTKKQYGTYIRRWLLFCDREKIDDKFDPTIKVVLKFIRPFLRSYVKQRY